MPSDVGTYNAGTEASLPLARAAAQTRATITGQPIALYEHVGGILAGKPVSPTGRVMWRDTLDAEGRELPPPRHVWRYLETVTVGP